MEVPVNRPILELTRRLKSNPGDETALFGFCRAVRSQGRVEELVALLDVWSKAEHDEGVPDHAIAELYFRIALRSSEAHARRLCRTALDVSPAHLGALLLFDSLVDESFADELLARCQAFLEEAPFQHISAEAQAFVVDKLADLGRAETRSWSSNDSAPAAPLVPASADAELTATGIIVPAATSQQPHNAPVEKCG